MTLGLFYLLAVSGLSIVGFVMAGWGSDNKYALLGGVRAGAQLISYEIPLVMAVFAVAMIGAEPQPGAIVGAQKDTPFIWLYQPLTFLIFAIAGLAELYRQPFDIPVAESEVVGGPFVEYSGIRWSMFQLGEFVNLVLISILGCADLPRRLGVAVEPVRQRRARLGAGGADGRQDVGVHRVLHVDAGEHAAPAHRPDDVVLLADAVAVRLAADRDQWASCWFTTGRT